MVGVGLGSGGWPLGSGLPPVIPGITKLHNEEEKANEPNLKAYIPVVLWLQWGRERNIFCVGKLQIHFSQIKISIFKKTFAYSQYRHQMFLILNKQSLWIESFALHVHFPCVGFDCQCKAKTTPSSLST